MGTSGHGTRIRVCVDLKATVTLPSSTDGTVEVIFELELEHTSFRRLEAKLSSLPLFLLPIHTPKMEASTLLPNVGSSSSILPKSTGRKDGTRTDMVSSLKQTLMERIAGCQDQVEKAALQHKMGVLCCDMDREREAEPWFAAAYETRRLVLGCTHVDTTESMHELGAVYSQLGEFLNAEVLLKKNHEEYQQVLGSQARETLQCERSLGLLYSRKGKLEDSENCLIQCIKDQTEAYGPDDSDTIESELALAKTFVFERKFSAAEAVYSECLEKQSRILGDDHVDTRRTRIQIQTAGFLHKQQHSRTNSVPDSPDTQGDVSAMSPLSAGAASSEQATRPLRKTLSLPSPIRNLKKILSFRQTTSA
eukprot:3571250-Rhodomonas_salina.3